jgi:hypothetical protein
MTLPQWGLSPQIVRCAEADQLARRSQQCLQWYQTGARHDCRAALTISSHFAPEMEPPAGTGPTGASEEVLMHYHRNLLPRIVVILRIVVKVIVTRR